MGGVGGTDRSVAGRYRLLERVGRGGMGTVWRAEDTLLGRLVAVKELHLDDGLPEEEARAQRERTLREARAVAQIKHPHVIVLHDVVVEPDDGPWIVMELVDGDSLHHRLAHHGPVSPNEAARIGLALVGALRAAHQRGVLHRDVKPANVLVEAGTERVVLSDFGIAQIAGSTTITVDGAFVGSPEYTAPERMEGQENGAPADLWSLGVLLCTLVHGESPFRRDSLSGILHAVTIDTIRLPLSLGPLLPVVEALLERDPQRRISADRAEALLRECRDPDATAAPPDRDVWAAPTTAGAPEDSGGTPGDGPGAGLAEGPAPAGPPRPGAALGEAPTVHQATTVPRPRRRGRTALLVALAVTVLAVAGSATAVLLNRDRGGEPNATPSGSASPGDDRPASPETPATPATTLPEGYRMIDDPAGFRLAVPNGFTRSHEPPRVYYYSPGREFRLGVHIQATSPEGPVEAMYRADAKGPVEYPGYRQNSVTELTHRGDPAALWEFTWDGLASDGGPRRTYDLSWGDNSTMYDLWISAPVDRSEEAKRHLDTATGSFTDSADD